MAFTIGQYRFLGSGCLSQIVAGASYNSTSMAMEGNETSTSFQDILITPANGQPFQKNTDYYMSIAIPQDMNYDMDFNIKLIKTINGTETAYQFLKKVSVLRGGTVKNVYDVALYEKNDGTIDVAIPLEYDALNERIPNIADALYIKKATDLDNPDDIFYLGTGLAGRYSRTTKYNDMSMIASWRESDSAAYIPFEFTFRPVEDDFTTILLEIVRSPEDYNIQRFNEDTNNFEYGRRIDLNKLNGHFNLYEMSNLVDKMNKNGSLSRIGVWSHPGLIMTINGEEIKVGPSGSYELDVLPISSIGIVAKGYEDNFTIDYAYDNAQSTETDYDNSVDPNATISTEEEEE